MTVSFGFLGKLLYDVILHEEYLIMRWVRNDQVVYITIQFTPVVLRLKLQFGQHCFLLMLFKQR